MRGEQIMSGFNNYMVLNLDELGIVTGGMPDEDHQNRFFEVRIGPKKNGHEIDSINEKEKYPA